MNLQVQPPRATTASQQGAASGGARRYVIGIAALVLVLGGYYWWSHRAPPPRRPNLAAPVRVTNVTQRDMAVVEHTIGTVVANSTVQVTARVLGQLTSAHFKEGQLVKKGDLLFTIDPRPYQAALESALATQAASKSAADRNARLATENAISAQANETAQAAYLQAKANADTARLNLEFTQIRSPIDGKTGPILLQPGNLVSVNGVTQPLVAITQVMPIKVSMSLPQSDLPRIQARAQQGGLTAAVDLHDVEGAPITAPVDFISNAVSNSAGTIELRATFPNANMALVPGQLVDVTIQLAAIKNATVVPRAAVNSGPQNQFVYVVSAEDTVEMHPVKVLFDDGKDMAIESDVTPGQTVIVDGALRAMPGGKVRVVRGNPGAGGAAAGPGGARKGGKGRGGRAAAAE